MKITVISAKSIGKFRSANKKETCNIIRKARSLPDGKAIRIYEPKKADLLCGRLYQYNRAHKLGLNISKKKNFVYIVKGETK